MAQPLDGSAQPTRVVEARGLLVSEMMTPDGGTLLFQQQLDNVWSIWSAELSGNAAPRSVVSERFDNYMPALSRDGHRLAYVSNSSGKREVYVRPYPGPGTPVQVSQEGGTEPAWSPDGRTLYYRMGNQLLRATVNSSDVFSVTERRLLFRRTFDGDMPHTNYIPTADGRFIMIGASSEPDMVIVVNWLTEFRAAVAAKR